MAVGASDLSIRFFGTGNAASKQQATTAGLDKNYTNNVSQEYMFRMQKLNFEENLLFPNFAMERESMGGYLTHSIYRAQKVTASQVTRTTSSGLTNTSSTIGATPTPISIQRNSVRITPEQFVANSSVADMIAEYNVFNWVNGDMRELMNAVGRAVDEYSQDQLYANATGTGGKIYYTNSITSINGYVTTNKAASVLKLAQVIEMNQRLVKANVPVFPALGSYVAILHPAVAYDLLSSVSTNAISDLFKHTPMAVRRLIKGYIGTIYGVSVMQSTNLKTKASTGTGTPTVYPSYFFGYGCYDKIRYSMRTYMTNSADSNDPANQLYTAAVKCEYGQAVTQNEGILTYLSTASIDL